MSSILRTSSFSPKYSDFIVRADGRGTHQTITAAITAASELDGPQTVLIGPGIYEEDLAFAYNVSLISLNVPADTLNLEGGVDPVPETAETIIIGNHNITYDINPHIITLKNIRFESNDIDSPVILFHNFNVSPGDVVLNSVFKFKNCTFSQFKTGESNNVGLILCPSTAMLGRLKVQFDECTFFSATIPVFSTYAPVFTLESNTSSEDFHENSFEFKSCVFLDPGISGQGAFYITNSNLTILDSRFITPTVFNLYSTESNCIVYIENTNLISNQTELFIDLTSGTSGTAQISITKSIISNRDVGGTDVELFSSPNKEMSVTLTDCTFLNVPISLVSGLAILTIANTLNTNATYTGDIRFDGIKILGSGTGSGDGLERGTIELVPDVDLYSISSNSGYGDAGQYLIIDPTTPSHIHIRAGGPIDEAAAILILGGEKANVTVRDQNDSYVEKHYVTINTQANAGDAYAWVFDNNGNLVLPAGGDIVDSTGTTVIGSGAVKLTAPNNRRIEEVHGYNSVSVTAIVTTDLTTVTSRAQTGDFIYIDSTTTTIDDIISTPASYENAYEFEFSLDNTTWYAYSSSVDTDDNERGYGISQSVTYLEDATVYFRYKTGGNPVVWWDAADLPGSDTDFRGAVIDYHAWTGESTIIGTIHIVDDSGEGHITHTEVQSGDEDGENDDLWLVQNEGKISYRRIDGESKTLEIQWTAKVFYGSELYD